jgi:hypothetical protein
MPPRPAAQGTLASWFERHASHGVPDMPVISSLLEVRGPAFAERRHAMQALVAELSQALDRTSLGGGEAARQVPAWSPASAAWPACAAWWCATTPPSKAAPTTR